MIKKKLAKKLGLALTLILSLNSTLAISVYATGDIAKEIANADVAESMKIMPMPKEMNVIGGIVNLNDSVNIVGGDSADAYAVELLKEILKNLGVTVNETIVDGATTIYIGESNDNLVEMDNALIEMGVTVENKNNPESYILATQDSENGDKIVIRGHGETGTFYGVQTLKQIVNKDKTLSEIVVKDEPSIALRAVVEGFYGTPWTQQERLDQLRMYGEYKMNAYIYAPKSDPYHREKWREPYPESELARMQELIQTADENKVDFVFAISPGLDIRFQGEEAEEDFKALINKSQTLYDMGVRRFAILWDDIENNDGAKQAEVLNRFNDEFIKTKGDVKSLITVPVQYWGSAMFDGDNPKEYTKAFAETLQKDIEVMWTGNDVIPPNGVSNIDASKVTDVYKKKMMLWWNYPVNDYMENKLALGPIYDLDKNLDNEISGFIVNPMRFAEASKISTITGADYGWNTKGYDYNRSWNNAIEIVGKDGANELKEFANHSTRLDTGRPDSPELNDLINKMWEKFESGQDVSNDLKALKDEFNNMIKTPNALREKLDNEALLSQIQDHLVKFEEYGRAGIKSIDMLEKVIANDMQGSWNRKFDGIKSLRTLDSMNATIANKVVDPFIRKAHEVATKHFNKNTTILEEKTYNYTPIGNIKDHKYTEWFISEETHVPKYMFDDNNNTGFWSEGNLNKDEYIGFDLEEVTDIKDVYLSMGRSEQDNDVITNGVVEYSIDGTNWTELKVNSGDRELVVETNLKARYLRYRMVENSTNRLYVNSFKINTNKTVEKNVSNVDLSEVSIEKSSNDYDKIVSLKNIGRVSLKEGDYIGFGLNDVNNVIGLETIGELNSNDFVVEYSYDNLHWEKILDGSGFNSEKPVVGKYFRIRALKDTSVNLEELNATIEGYTASTVTTNRRISTNGNIHPNFVVDNDYGSSFVCSDTIKENDFVQIDFGKVKNVRDISLIQGPGGDYINGNIEYSLDGESWTKVGEVQGTDTLIKDLDIEAQYVRVLSSGYKDRWSRVREFTVNTTIKEYKTVASAEGTYTDRTENTRDGNLNTAYIPNRDIVAGDYFLYRIFDGKLTSKVTIPQSFDNLSGAKVTAQTVNGEILELGVLDKDYNEFVLNIPRQLVSVKLTWETNAGKPEIFEIKPTFVSLSSIMENINDAMADAEKTLVDNPNKKNDERVALEESLSNIKKVLSNENASEDEKVRAYEDLINKTESFKNSKVDPEKPGTGDSDSEEGNGSGSGNNGSGNNNSNSGGQSYNGGNSDDDKGNLPITGAAVGVTALGVMGSLMALAGTVMRKKKKK
ncbi:MAG: beta-N-acetylglucosaminidase domain-containing protein [Clostridium septicum]|uniref:beta-N-acetylglucosaminidase domain-containing protein n=1 Tax=Clostridium septicum TaxID=1504 RepID=UPI002586CBDB|nr:beta-N-acetylglucosaminidase domain-containing protein [Clostridium septicum]MDU1314083.1 beta-N-acetylglucosaminidase domain-containing protein [Clostridium septicum]